MESFHYPIIESARCFATTVTVTTGIDEPTTFQWDRLTVSTALAFCLLVPALSVGVVLAELIDQFHISSVIAALHGSTFGVGLLACGVFGVRLIDWIGRRLTVALAATMILTGVTCFVLGPAWPITLAGTAVSGTGSALLVMTLPGVVSDHHGEHRAQAFAAVNAAPAVAGVVFSLVIGTVLGAGWSWRPAYLMLTAALGVLFFTVARRVQAPTGVRQGTFSLRHFRDRAVLVPWLHIVHAVMTEFTIGVWSVTYLRDVGGASAGSAPVLSAVFPICMFASRLRATSIIRRLGAATTSVAFAMAGLGAAVMCFAPSLGLKVAGLAVVGTFGGLLYPMAVDRFYQRAQHTMDSVSLGAYAAMGNGVAVTIGPLVLGVLADTVHLRWAILVISALAFLGTLSQWPRRAFTHR
ncbi:unannotated protein [freshwater metagenome]|uniref:Unannotated protein n=1 Tax=freshwater metagenome TaxID=449393 RepID=A0A6J7MME6_9ZZZZ